MTYDKPTFRTKGKERHALWYLCLMLFLSIACSGCALSQQSVRLAYVPDGGTSVLAGADKVSIILNGSDRREIKHKVSAKRNGFGMEMAPISAENDPLDLLVEAIGTELKQRGFLVGKGPTEVVIGLTKFYSNFEIGFWSGNAIADVAFSVEVRRPNTAPIYNREVHETHNLHGVMLYTGGNAKIALDAALKASVSKLFGDEAFIAALWPDQK